MVLAAKQASLSHAGQDVSVNNVAHTEVQTPAPPGGGLVGEGATGGSGGITGSVMVGTGAENG